MCIPRKNNTPKIMKIGKMNSNKYTVLYKHRRIFFGIELPYQMFYDHHKHIYNQGHYYNLMFLDIRGNVDVEKVKEYEYVNDIEVIFYDVLKDKFGINQYK
jgi:hypothetical protein